MSLVAYLRGWVSVYWLCAVCAVSLRDCWAYASGGEGGPQRSDGTLARIVDVLGVAAPHGPGVVWYATRRVNAQMGERILVVYRYAVCLGDGRPFCSAVGGKRAK
uniref:Transmembrane protein n=1 Tax=Toxoplasma gondii (strain ATCC 50861 / VEG) TaxID=432359 RepID=A0A0F7V6A0_TOXGV|nr:TPA: hypothetical protein BN1205_007340 [Toxoplasma gondii VEG]